MLEALVTLFLVALLVVVLIGLSATALLLIAYGPGAAAAFAAAVLAHRMGADPLACLGVAVTVFVSVTALVKLAIGVLLDVIQRLLSGRGLRPIS